MSPEDDPLIWRALCALDEVADQCSHGPVRPTMALRVALYVLWRCRVDRDGLVRFLATVSDPMTKAYSVSGANYERSTLPTMYLHGISRAAGIDRRLKGVCESMRSAWSRPSRAVPSGSSAAGSEWLLVPILSIEALAALVVGGQPGGRLSNVAPGDIEPIGALRAE